MATKQIKYCKITTARPVPPPQPSLPLAGLKHRRTMETMGRERVKQLPERAGSNLSFAQNLRIHMAQLRYGAYRTFFPSLH